MLEKLLRRRRSPEAPEGHAVSAGPAATRPARKRYSATDAVLVGIGIGLCAASAMFPWYVFFNQEQFTPPSIAFESRTGPSDLSGPFYTPRVQWQPKPLTEAEIAALTLDMAPTGTVPMDRSGPSSGPGVSQPFPQKPVTYTLVHVANGRAMIQDERGVWVVERGSVLPDDSRVSAIEQRSGKWVIRTSEGRIVELGQ